MKEERKGEVDKPMENQNKQLPSGSEYIQICSEHQLHTELDNKSNTTELKLHTGTEICSINKQIVST